jgi:hypothetical protein
MAKSQIQNYFPYKKSLPAAQLSGGEKNLATENLVTLYL